MLNCLWIRGSEYWRALARYPGVTDAERRLICNEFVNSRSWRSIKEILKRYCNKIDTHTDQALPILIDTAFPHAKELPSFFSLRTFRVPVLFIYPFLSEMMIWMICTGKCHCDSMNHANFYPEQQKNIFHWYSQFTMVFGFIMISRGTLIRGNRFLVAFGSNKAP